MELLGCFRSTWRGGGQKALTLSVCRLEDRVLGQKKATEQSRYQIDFVKWTIKVIELKNKGPKLQHKNLQSTLFSTVGVVQPLSEAV